MAAGKHIGLLLVLCSSLFYALCGIISKALLNADAPAFFVLISRNYMVLVMVALILLCWNRSLFRVERGDRLQMLITGLMMLVYSGCYFCSMMLLNVSVAVILLYTYPAMVAVASVFVFKERLTAPLLAALLMTFGGILLTLNIFDGIAGQISPAGVALAILAAMGAAAYAIYAKKLTAKYHGLTINFYCILTGVVFYTFFLPFVWPQQALSGLTWLGVGGTAVTFLVGFALYVLGMRYLRASQASIIGSSEPIFSLFFAALLLSELITASQLCGAALVLAAIVLLQSGGLRKKAQA